MSALEKAINLAKDRLQGELCASVAPCHGGAHDPILVDLVNAVVAEAEAACEGLSREFTVAGKTFDEDDEPGNPRRHFMAMAVGAKDAARAVRSLKVSR